jgi:hypothetical protein
MLLGVDGPILPENGPCNENFGELGLKGKKMINEIGFEF